MNALTNTIETSLEAIDQFRADIKLAREKLNDLLAKPVTTLDLPEEEIIKANLLPTYQKMSEVDEMHGRHSNELTVSTLIKMHKKLLAEERQAGANLSQTLSHLKRMCFGMTEEGFQSLPPDMRIRLIQEMKLFQDDMRGWREKMIQIIS